MSSPSWTEQKAITLNGLRVTLSQPVAVGRSRGYYWFPTLHRRPSGELMATIDPCPDINVSAIPSLVTFSSDGLTWSEPKVAIDGGEMLLNLANGDTLLLPFSTRPRPGGMGAPYNRFRAGEHTFEYVVPGIVVTGWPRPDKARQEGLDVNSMAFDGQAVPLQDGRYLGTMHGHFMGDTTYSTVVVDTADGENWVFRSVVADGSGPVVGKEGPCESALCRLKDGRLLAVFRVGSRLPFGQAYSSDEGRTWTPAVQMAGPYSVQPSLAVMQSGLVALSGGRPGLGLWLDREGQGETWQGIDLMAHHNACCPGETIQYPEQEGQRHLVAQTTSYTEVVALDEMHLLYMYDRCPNGWRFIPDEMDDTNSVWVVRVTVEL